MIEKVSNVKPSSKVKLMGFDPCKSSAVIEKIVEIGKSAIASDPVKLRSNTSNESMGLCSDMNMIPKGKVNSIVKGISSIAPILCSNSEENNYPETTPTEKMKIFVYQTMYGSGTTTTTTPNHQEETSSSSEEEEEDFDEYVARTKEKIQENSTSYDSASYLDFESLVSQSIHNHFLDDDNEQDSMNSASTYSGYEHEDNSRKISSSHHLVDNSLISTSSYHRLKGTIAVKKKKTSSKDKVLTKDSTIDKSGSIARQTRTVEKQAVPETMPPEEELDETVDQHTDESSTVMTSNSYTTAEYTTGNSCITDCIQTNSFLYAARAKATQPEPRMTNSRYDIDPDDNSIISQTPYQPPSSRRRRKRRVKRSRARRDHDESSVLTEDGWDHEELTINDVASILKQESRRGGRIEEGVADSEERSPGRFSAVLEMVNDQLESLPELGFTHVNQNIASHNEEATASESSLSQHRNQSLERSYKIYLCKTPDKNYEADKSRDGHDVRSSRRLEFREDYNMSMSSPDAAEHSSPSNFSSVHFWDEDIVPDISVDAQSISLPAIDSELAAILESSYMDDGVHIDEMIDHFLTGKMERLNLRNNERDVIIAKKNQVLGQLLQRQEEMIACFDSAPKFIGEPNAAHDPASENICDRSRALIRKLRSKRKALALAKELERSDRTFTDGMSDNQKVSSPFTGRTSEQTSREMPVEAPAMQDVSAGTAHELELEIFLNLGSPESISSSTEDKKSRLSKLKAKRKRILKSQNWGLSASERPLIESLDEPWEDRSDENIKAEVKTKHSPASGLGIKRFPRHNRSKSYESLPENDRSFDFDNFGSDEMNQVFAPPSPESPISMMHSDVDEFDDTIALFVPIKADGSLDHAFPFDARLDNPFVSPKVGTKPSGQVMFISTDSRSSKRELNTSPHLQVDTSSLFGQPADDFNDSFDAIVRRKTPSNDLAQEDEKPLFIVRKVSPTSVSDFFANYEPSKNQAGSDTLAFVDEEERDPVFFDEDASDPCNTSVQVVIDLVQPEFHSTRRFEC